MNTQTWQIVLGVLIATVFVFSDNTTQFLIFCAKDYAFSMAVMWMLFILLFTEKRVVSLPLSSSLVVALIAATITISATLYLPDTFKETNAVYSRHSYPVLELSWFVLITLMSLTLLRVRPLMKPYTVGFYVIALAMISTTHIITKENQMVTVHEETFTLIEDGQLKGQEWLVNNVDYGQFIQRFNDYKGGDYRFEMTSLFNNTVQMQLSEMQGDVSVTAKFVEVETYYPLSINNVIGNAFIWLSWVLMIAYWPSRRRIEALMTKRNVARQ